MKKLLSALLALFLLLSAAGCSSVLEGEVSEISPYLPASSPAETGSKTDGDPPVLNTDEEFIAAVNAMLSAGEAAAAFRLPITDNTEQRENELTELCREIALKTPLGSWAVYYITCKLTPIVSYYEASISISYKRTSEEIASLFTAASIRYLDARLQAALTGFDTNLAFYTSLNDITGDYIISRIKALYDSLPLVAVMQPVAEVTSSPASSGDRIMEITLTWEFPSTVLADMQKRVEAQVDTIAGRTADTGDANIITAFCAQLAKKAVIVNHTSPLQDTAYSVLVSDCGSADGFARAFKALCDRMNIDCLIVNGWHDGEEYVWNMVFCENSWYHIDITGSFSDSEYSELLSGDNSFIEKHYIWNTEDYPACPDDFGTQLPPEEPAASAIEHISEDNYQLSGG